MTTEKEQLEAEIAQRDERIAELEGLMAWQAKAIQEEREAYAMSMKDLQTSAVHLLFDGPPGPECGRFVEAEDPTGKSINAGEWSQRPDGYWQLVIQQPSAGVACALMSALEGIVHDQRVPNEVSQECAAVLIEARRLNPSPQPRAGVVLPERKMFSEYDPHPEYPSGWNDCLDEVERLNPCRAQASGDSE